MPGPDKDADQSPPQRPPLAAMCADGGLMDDLVFLLEKKNLDLGVCVSAERRRRPGGEQHRQPVADHQEVKGQDGGRSLAADLAVRSGREGSSSAGRPISSRRDGVSTLALWLSKMDANRDPD